MNYNLDNYRALLRLALASGYNFADYEIESPKGKTIFLRHDIDYSLNWALLFAEINSGLGVSSTFFVQLRCPLYNIYAYPSQLAIKKLIRFGQKIGLHVVIENEPKDHDDIELFIKEEWRVFKEIVPEASRVFAWHNPSALDHLNEFKGAEFGGLLNAYGEFAGGEYPYKADSNMRYSYSELERIISSDIPVFQLALAPLQWIPGKPDMKGALASTMVQKIIDSEQEFQTNIIYHESLSEGISDRALFSIEKIITDELKG